MSSDSQQPLAQASPSLHGGLCTVGATMRIPNQYPQFSKERAMLVVASRTALVCYEAAEGMVTEKLRLSVPEPHYSDREGFFERRSYGRVLGHGSVLEWRNQQQLKQEILRQFETTLRQMAYMEGHYDTVYLFAPDYRARAYRRRLPGAWRKRLTQLFYGNFVAESPMLLLERIAERRQAGTTEPISGEAKRILEKADRARGVIRTRARHGSP